MRIAFDLHGIQSDGSRSRGIGRYSLDVIKNLITGFPQHDFILISNAALADLKHEFNSFLYYKNVTYIQWFSPCPVDFVSGNKTKRKIAKYLKSYTYGCVNADIIVITSFFEGYIENCLVDFDRDFIDIPIISIFYDLIPYINQDLYLKTNPNFEKFYNSRLAEMNKLDGLLSISDSSAKEAIKYLQIDANKVFNISSACNQNIFNKDSDIDSLININDNEFAPFILYSGAIDPRKNVKRLIEAFSKLPSELDNYKLVLVGKLLPIEIEMVSKWINLYKINPNKVITTGYLSDYNLVQLYRKCKLFVFPSLHEGFGLPVLEAMSCGAPVIGSNSTSIPEVISQQSAMFDPTNVDEIKDLIYKALTNKSFRDVLIKNSSLQSKKFSWHISAQAVIDACELIIKRKETIGKKLDWNYLVIHKQKLFNLLLKKLRKLKSVNIINNSNELFLQSCAALDKITSQIDYLLRQLSYEDETLSWRVEGPFDSSYSLSILNRSFAYALQKQIKSIYIHITEGFGDYSPNINYLQDYPEIYSLYKYSKTESFVTDVISRNLYPPRVNDMDAKINILHSYGWEESAFPSEWVDDFNSYLQGITVMSEQVKKILIDNGVKLPIKVAGLGIDHLNNVQSVHDLKINAKKYKILHISSCFPRKGIDILLQAYAEVFSIEDDVSLIIKTFDNPHNKIDSILQNFRRTYPKFPDVVVIKDDLNEGQIKALYQESDLLVAPSRGEGFGLPIAEAMLFGLPVITTNWGGQLDFCDSTNSWLIDYQFVRSDSHFNLSHSYWAEPLRDDLSKLILQVYNLPKSEIEKKVELARSSISRFNWDIVAKKNISFVKNNLSQYKNQATKIGWLTTWNQKCGIASYSRNFIDCLIDEVLVFSPFNEVNDVTNQRNIIPSWHYPHKSENNLDELYFKIISLNITSLVIQFNYSFFDFREFPKFIQKIIDKKINLIIFLHSTIDPDEDELKKLSFLAPCLKKSNRLFVHTINDLNRLKMIGLVENVSIFPHPIKNIPCPTNQMQVVPKIRKSNKLNICSYGFCLPNKGFHELINSIPYLNHSKLDFHINIFSSIYNKNYYYVYKELVSLVKQLGVEKQVSIVNDYLSSNDIQSLLSQQDVIIYPYQSSNESSSASVRDGLSTLKPVLVTPLSIFDDVFDLVDYLPGLSPMDLANGILSWHAKYTNDPKRSKKLNESRAKIINSLRFSKLSLRLDSIIKSLEINQY